MTTSNKIISIIVPLFNDKSYIARCVDSILENKSDRIEIIISNDQSTDGSLDICKTYADPRIKIIGPEVNIGTVNNWLYGLKNATGTYVYFLAGDDYLAPGILDKIIDKFDGYSIYTAPMNCFDDDTGEVFDRLMYPDQYSKMFKNKADSFIENYLNYYNHDEMSLNFFPREKLNNLNQFMRFSVNSVFWFWVALIFEKQNVKHISDTVLHKRYNHTVIRTKWTVGVRKKSQLSRIIQVVCQTHVFKSFCDIYNSLILYKNLKSLKILALLLFSNRRIIEKKTGLFGLFPRSNRYTFRPNVLIEFLVSPLFLLKSLYKILRDNVSRV